MLTSLEFRSSIVGFLLALTLLAGCAHKSVARQSPRETIDRVCGIAEASRGVRGSIWMKAKSKEASGQFPASVLAEAPERLRIEVTNLLGGPEAVIELKGRSFTIHDANGKRVEQGSGAWGGIPLQWAHDLFLGKIPCPPARARAEARWSSGADEELIVTVPASLESDGETYAYRFRSWAGSLWPEALHWERLGNFKQSVDFKFDDPDDATRSPRKWEAKSPFGEVKVRWKDRELTR